MTFRELKLAVECGIDESYTALEESIIEMDNYEEYLRDLYGVDEEEEDLLEYLMEDLTYNITIYGENWYATYEISPNEGVYDTLKLIHEAQNLEEEEYVSVSVRVSYSDGEGFEIF